MGDWQTGWSDYKDLISHLIANIDDYSSAPANEVSNNLRKALREHLEQAETNAGNWSRSTDSDALIKEKLSDEDVFFNIFILVLSLSSSEFPQEWKDFFENEVLLNQKLKLSF